ncbi:MFS transporter [Sporolactobacillus shoreae]|uniref:MFS transporter n=1 Tax=Sporolactobacillus shoreae TaxID=1465501 RepID=A0A4Z0GRH6_9BACL|nr:MFS transporter [Sporolactobacillus shoreae]TGA98835.1 MFS transporter [Sporolactobacillus shoreae]
MNNTIASHNIRLLFWSGIFGTMNFLQPVLTLFYLQRGLDTRDIFMVLFCWSLAVLIGEIPTGVYADRFGPKVSFITGCMLRLVSFSLLFFASGPWMFYLYSFLNGFSVTFYSGADEAFIYESLKESHEENKMDQAMGHIQSADFIAMIVSVLIGAFLARDLSNQQFLVLIVLTIAFQLVELMLIFFLRKPVSDTVRQVNNPFRQVKEGFKVIRREPRLLIMFLNVTLVFIPVGAVFKNFDQPYLTHAGVPVASIGVLYAAAAVLGFGASHSIGWLTHRFSRIALMYATGFLSVSGLVLAALIQSEIWAAVGIFFLLRIVQVIRYPIYSKISNDYIPSSVRATTISLLSIVDSCCDLFVFLILSLVASGNSLHVIFLGGAFIVLAGVLLPIRPLKIHRDERLNG